MSDTATVCANCGAVLFKQWFDWERRAFDCHVCHALTGPGGELLADPPPPGQARSRSFDPRGWVLVGATIIAVVVIYLAQQVR